MNTFLLLFFSFFQVGLFSFGGGFAAMPLIEEQVVQLNQWLTVSQFTDLVTIAEMTPGPIAINAATFVGTQVAGLPGAIIATFGAILPSILIVFLLAWLYVRYQNLKVVNGILSGLRPVIVAAISIAGITILRSALFNQNSVLTFQGLNLLSIALFAFALYSLRVLKHSPIQVMLTCGIFGGLLYLIF